MLEQVHKELDKVKEKYFTKIEMAFCKHENDEETAQPGGGGYWRCFDCGREVSF